MLLALWGGCASPAIVDSEKIIGDMQSARRSLSMDKGYMGTLAERKAGKTGFYYIINRDGLVVYHPVTVLMGSNFKRYSFLDGVLKARSGCFQYTFGDIRYLLFFESLNENDILCLAIPKDEVAGADRFCRTAMETKDN